MSADQKTLDVYDKYISDYKKLISKELKDANLDIFMKMIERDGKVLDLGCGTGTASRELLKNGFAPFPIDASLEMIKVAEKWKPYRTLACLYLWDMIDGPFEW